METMRAVVIHEWNGELQLEHRPRPDPGAGEVRVRVVGCGLGLTIRGTRSGALGGSLPRILGHEFAGLVEDTGDGVTTWAAGDRVTGSFYLMCGECRWCTGGRETLCENMRGYVGVHVDGALAEWLVVPARNLVRVPVGVELASAGIVADAIATPYHVATRRAPITPGDRVAVVGAGGGVGVHMIEIAKAFGAQVIAVERDADKLAQLEQLEPYAIVDASDGNWPEQLRTAAGGDLGIYIDMVSSEETLAAGVAALGRGGTFVIVGFTPGIELKAQPATLILDEVTVTGTRYATRAEIAAALELVEQGRVRVVVGATYDLEHASEAMRAIEANEVFGRVLVRCGSDA